MLAECQQKRKIITLLSVCDAVKRDVPKRVIGYRGEKKKKGRKRKKGGTGDRNARIILAPTFSPVREGERERRKDLQRSKNY